MKGVGGGNYRVAMPHGIDVVAHDKFGFAAYVDIYLGKIVYVRGFVAVHIGTFVSGKVRKLKTYIFAPFKYSAGQSYVFFHGTLLIDTNLMFFDLIYIA